MSSGHIYIVRLRESIRLKENVYKCGRTKNMFQRIKTYPLGTELLYCVQVHDMVAFEQLILSYFREHFTPIPEMGAEYFKGNLIDMIKLINNHLLQYIDTHQEENSPSESKETYIQNDIKTEQDENSIIKKKKKEVKPKIEEDDKNNGSNVNNDNEKKMSAFICEFCNSSFCKASNLRRHKITSTSCKIIQQNQGIEVQQNNLECNFCHKSFTLKFSLVKHFNICKALKQLEVDDASQITNNINNNYNIHVNERFKLLEVFDMEAIKNDIQQRITESILKSGLDNTANHIANSISPYVITTDSSRQNIIIKDKYLKCVKKNAIQLSTNVIKTCSYDIVNKCDNALKNQLDILKENSFEMQNIKIQNNIIMVRSNVIDINKDNISYLSKKTASYLVRKSYDPDDITTTNSESESEEEISINSLLRI
jgi:hypothetical protein